MNLSRLSLALLPLAFAPMGCSQPAGQVSDQSSEYSNYYESTGNEATAADQSPQLELIEVRREMIAEPVTADDMTVQNDAAAEPQMEAESETSPVSTAAEEVKPEEVAAQQDSTFKDESAEQSEHIDPPQSALEVSLAEVEQELVKAKETLEKYSTQQEKKDFRNGAQKLLDETIDSNKPLRDDIARLQSELAQKQQQLEAVTMLTDQVQEQIDKLDPTSAEPDEQLRNQIRESLAQLRHLKSESDRRFAQKN